MEAPDYLSPTGHVSDFGVVSGAQRSLRADDQPYLGIVSDPRWDVEGGMIGGVEAGSGAHRSGLLAGDVLMKLNGKMCIRDSGGSDAQILQLLRPGNEPVLKGGNGLVILGLSLIHI